MHGLLRSASPIAAFLLAISACRHAEPVRSAPAPAPAPSTAASATAYGEAEILALAAELATAEGIEALRRAEIDTALRKLLRSPDFAREQAARGGVKAVGAYRLGEGALVVKVGRGHGSVRFAGETTSRRFELKQLAVGAMVGGEASWGVMLGLGPVTPTSFAGEYTGPETTATAADEKAGALRLLHDGNGVVVFLTGTGAGLSASAGVTHLTVGLLAR